MSKIEELEARLAEMQAELEALKAEKAADAEWPKKGDIYFSIATFGNVVKYRYGDDGGDMGLASIGNIFRTRQETEAEIEARKVISELRRQPGARRFVVGDINWSVTYNAQTRTLNLCCWTTEPCIQNSVWFDSKESASIAIQAVGEERIIKATRWWALGEC